MKKVEELKIEDIQESTNKPIEVYERPSEDLPMNKLSFVIGSSLKPHIEKLENDRNGIVEVKGELNSDDRLNHMV